MSYLQKVSRVFSDNETDIRKIIKVFNIIMKVNTFVESQRYIYLKKLHEIILIDRKTYQQFIECVIQSKVFDDQSHTVNQKIKDENNVLKKMFSDAVLNVDLNESKNDMLLLRDRASTKSFAVKRNQKLKDDKYKKFFVLFNVHADLHLIDMTREYVIVINVNVLSYEMKHM